jgi:hypothetical protein
MKNYSNALEGLFATFAALALGFVAASAFAQDRLTQLEVNKQISDEMKKSVEPFNRRLPQQIDEGILLEKVTVGPGVLMNFHSLLTNVASKDINAAQMNGAIRPLIKNHICGNADAKPLMQYGAKFVYTFRANDGVAVGNFRFDRTDCGYPAIRP